MSDNNFNSQDKELSQVILLGSLAIFKTHPYAITDPQQLEDVVIQDAQITDSPIMVVAETLKHFRDVHDENTGDKITVKGGEDCKCIWYNPKTGSYEETWISDRQLIIIDAEKNDSMIKLNDVVFLKSLPIEKRKLSRTYERRINQNSTDTYRIKGLHTFEPPLMQVIEIKKNINEDKYDTKFGKKKKYISEKSMKCKWFNTTLNKFSETWLPIDTLQPRKNYLSDRVSEINEYIKEKKLLKSERFLLIPTNIISDGFYCKISGFDIISNTQINTEIDEKMHVINKDEYLVDFKNFIDFAGTKEEKKEEVINYINDKIGKNAIRIVYKNLKGNLTTRVLTDYFIEENMLKGYCHLRHDNRFFNLNKIRTIEVLDFNYYYDNTI